MDARVDVDRIAKRLRTPSIWDGKNAIAGRAMLTLSHERPYVSKSREILTSSKSLAPSCTALAL